MSLGIEISIPHCVPLMPVHVAFMPNSLEKNINYKSSFFLR